LSGEKLEYMEIEENGAKRKLEADGYFHFS
jgi:hypothetical protein